ncbi:MAG: helix-turn-helix domain-containing protein [Candidatus Sulfobium sp.]|jgi:DNA-binding transcriptional regulator YiaG
MNGIARLLRETVERTARKQVRSETEALRKASSRYRKTIADLSSRLKEVEREVSALRKQVSSVPPAAGQYEAGGHRFSAKGLQSLRKKLGLSKTECGRLIGVSGRTVGKWESGLARPTEEEIKGIVSLRRTGKREVNMRLGKKGRMKK